MAGSWLLTPPLPHPWPCSDFSECQLSCVPGEIGALTRLQRLDLHSNRIPTLPPTISALAHLNRLSLHRWEAAACALCMLGPGSATAAAPQLGHCA
jgi:hypothetical protein